MSLTAIPHVDRPSNAWVSFSYISFGGSVLLVAGGIASLPLDWWVRGYFAIGTVMLMQSCFTLATVQPLSLAACTSFSAPLVYAGSRSPSS